MLTLTQKELGHALFYSLKRGDLDHAEYLLSIDAPVNTSYFIAQDKIAYTQNLLVGVVAKTLRQYGAIHARSQQALRLFNIFCEKKSDFRCHCIPKHPHYCAIGEALKHLAITCPQDLQVEQKFLLMVKLILNGATFKNITNSKDYIWSAMRQLQSYVKTKGDQALLMHQTNRHIRTVPCKQSRPSTCPKVRK